MANARMLIGATLFVCTLSSLLVFPWTKVPDQLTGHAATMQNSPHHADGWPLAAPEQKQLTSAYMAREKELRYCYNNLAQFAEYEIHTIKFPGIPQKPVAHGRSALPSRGGRNACIAITVFIKNNSNKDIAAIEFDSLIRERKTDTIVAMTRLRTLAAGRPLLQIGEEKEILLLDYWALRLPYNMLNDDYEYSAIIPFRFTFVDGTEINLAAW
jgi:hypothetical protein